MGISAKKQAKDQAASSGGSKSAKSKKPRAENKTGGKNRRFVLIIGDEGAILIFMQGAKVLRRLFAPSAQPSHTEAMVDLMQANPSVPLFVLADVLDQQYVSQTFPPVSALSVGGLVNRRLGRDFQPDDLKGALQLGRDKTGRKEWRYLLIALAKTPLMSEWLDLLVELPNEMKGIYLVPVEAMVYVEQLNKKLHHDKSRPWQLFISHNKVSGFRQVVLHEGKLVFTRVSQAIDDAIPAVIAGNVEQEIINTVEYLKRLGFQDNSELDAIVVISQDVIDSLDLKRFGFTHAEALTPQNVADKLALEQAALSADRFGDVVMAASFGVAKKRALRFSTAYIDKLAKLYKARQGIRAAMILLVLLFAGLTVMSAIGIIDSYSKISTAESDRSKLQGELGKLQKSVEGLNKDLAFKTAMVSTYDAYIKDMPTPESFTKDLMPFTSAQHRIVEISWKYEDIKEGASPPAPGKENLPLNVKMKVDLSGVGGGAEMLTRSADDLIADMKAKLPQYEIAAEAYPWKKDEQKAESLSLDLGAGQALAAQDMIATITFRGVKKVATPPGGAGAPGQVKP